ncbi:class I SAM-dependent methyltransferase [Gilvibacter sediminis]|uniref:class I SAM-dependent methyltransferase n=1 Tax=Gilvibacter sediminis TaxID=379071 RepID=UPI002350F41B|nr:class I SAM-dependent methyltransferase [Gilvibacter sediminis]MDC7997742.1 class I SAM-dependent methyltransferase [Gilvibacter sediminis]
MANIQKLLRKVKYKLFGNPYYKRQQYQGVNLPSFRENQGLSENEDYLQSAVEQLESIQPHKAFSHELCFLDFGCGQGRIANGIQYLKLPFHTYTGVDTHELSINWCKKWISAYGSAYQFLHVPAYNKRYNKQAEKLQVLPFEDNSFDMIFLNSVFSHMITADVQFYLDEFSRLMKTGGLLYVTGFVEEGVPEMEENPENYISENHGALFRVRYEKSFFLKQFTDRGFTIKDYNHQGIARTKQSVVMAIKS